MIQVTVREGKGKGKPAEPAKGKGRSPGAPTGKGDPQGPKGKGARKNQLARSAPDDGWTTVHRRRAMQQDGWKLRSTDWNAPAYHYTEVADALQKMKGAAFRAVVLCDSSDETVVLGGF